MILSSFVFIDYRNEGNKNELEIYEATIFLTNVAQGVNDYNGNKF